MCMCVFVCEEDEVVRKRERESGRECCALVAIFMMNADNKCVYETTIRWLNGKQASDRTERESADDDV